MRTRMIIAALLSVFFTVPFIYGAAYAEDTLKDMLSKRYKEEKDICPVVKKSITEGINTQDVTRACIEAGHDACLVIRCAIEAKGNLEQIITGALEAGTTSDVCSRCAVDAGVKAGNIAKILETGLGYSPAFGAGLTPVEIGIPGGNNKGSVLSRSSF